jgi:ABC-2 type transport system permease protein
VSVRSIAAVVRRDLTVALGSKAVVIPALVVPMVLLVVLPALAGLAPTLVDTMSAGDLTVMLDILPDDVTARLSDDPGLQAAEVLVGYLLAPLVLLVPVMFAAVLAADAVAGEKERGTLEGLLLTPISDRELIAAKLMSAWMPAVILGIGGAILYATVANLSVGSQLGRLVLPTPEFLVMALWTGPTLAAMALSAVLLVSVRVETTQAAFQLGGVVVLPVIAILITQATGALLLSAWLLVLAGFVALAVAAGLLVLGASSLARPRLGVKLR